MKQPITIILSLVFITLLVSCQATPEELVVKSKAGDELEKVIQSTPDHTLNETTGETKDQSTSSKAVNSLTNIKKSETNDANTITVNIDANVVMPQTSKMPVAIVERQLFTLTEMDSILETLFHGAVLYDVEAPLTKKQIEERILNIKREAKDLESDLAQSNGITTLGELETLAKEYIASYEKQHKNAPDTIPPAYLDIRTRDFAGVKGDMGQGEMAEFFFFRTDAGDRIEFKNFGGYNLPRVLDGYRITSMQEAGHNETGIEFEDAKQQALSALTAMGIADMVLTQGFLSEDTIGGAWEPAAEDSLNINSGRQFYVFCFERAINDAVISNAFYNIGGVGEEDVAYACPLEYEKIQLWIDHTGIVQFIWESPLKIVEVLNDKVDIKVDTDAAADVMIKQAFIQYAGLYDGDAEFVVINVDRMELTLARIRYKGHPGKYIVVPVWDFYGDIRVHVPETAHHYKHLKKSIYPQDDSGLFIISDPLTSIMTVNALDGTIIDRRLGY